MSSVLDPTLASGLDPVTVQYLVELYADLKPGDNPFIVEAKILKGQLYPDLPSSFNYQLYVISGIYGVALLCAIVTMIMRFRRNASMSLFRYIPTSKGSFWCPQTSNTFSLLTGAFLVITQGNIWITIQVNRDQGSQINIVLWRSLIWIPLWFTLVFEAWGTLITTLMSSRRYKREGGAFIPPIPPVIINVFWIVLTIFWTAAIITLFLIANDNYNKAFRLFQELIRLLALEAPTYDGNLANISQFAALFPLVTPFLKHIKSFGRFHRLGYIMWSASALSVLVIYLPIVFLYIKTLREQIAILQSRSRVGRSSFFSYGDPAAMNGPGKPKLSKEDAKLHDSLTTAYRNLIISCITISLCSVLYASIGVWIAIDSRHLIHSTVPLQIEILGSLYLYGVLGLAANVLTMIRAFDQSTNHKLSSRSGPSEHTKVQSMQMSPYHHSEAQRMDARVDFGEGYDPKEGEFNGPPTIIPIRTQGQMWDVVDYYSEEEKSEHSSAVGASYTTSSPSSKQHYRI